MPRKDIYTVAEAARRVGLTPSQVRIIMKRDEFHLVSGSHPALIHAPEVDAMRASELAKFEDVVDASGGLPVRHEDAGMERTRALLAEQWLRDVATSEQILDQGVELIRQARKSLVLAILSGLPTSPPNAVISASPSAADPREWATLEGDR